MEGDFTGADIEAGMSGTAAPAEGTVAAAPVTETTTAATGTGTTAPAAVSQPAAKPAGPIPFDVHHTALENARVKAIEDYRAKHGWAEKVSQAEYQQVQRLAQRLNADPVNALQELIAEVNANPAHAEQVRSLVARSLAAGRGQQAPTMPVADVEITDANGNVVGHAFSDKAQAQRDAVLIHQVMAKVDEKYAPVVKTHEEVARERATLKAENEANTWNAGFKSELETYPGFKDNKENQIAMGQEVLRLLSQYDKNDPRTNDPAFLEALTLRAYNRIVVPKLDGAARQAVVHDMNTKGSTTGVTPGRAPVGAPKRSADGRFSGDDIAAEFARRRLG